MNKKAIVGVSFNGGVFYNIVDLEIEFEYTGMAIISSLLNDKNGFVSDVIESQSYESIIRILDDQFDYGVYSSHANTNISSLSQINSLLLCESNISHVYIYEMKEDILLVKTPEMDKMKGLDYKNSLDVREFRNSLRW